MKNVKKVALISAVCLGTFMATLDISIVNVALPAIQEDLRTDLATLQWVVDAYALCLSALILSVGPLSDRYGRKKIWLIGIAVFTLGSVACAMAESAGYLLIGRIIQGIAAAALIPGALSIITHAFPNDIERIKVIGGWSAVSALSLIIGPILGGFLVHTTSWSMIFLINIPIGILTLLLGYYGIKESANPDKVSLDPVGQLLSISGLGCLTFGLIEAGVSGWLALDTLVFIFIGVASLIIFMIVEKKIENPLFPFHLFKNRSFFQYNLTSFVLGFATYSNVFFIAIFLQKGQGWNALETGWRMAPEFIAMTIFSFSFSRLASYFSVHKLMIIGLVFIGLSSLLLSTVAFETPYYIMSIYLFILGAGMGLSTPAVGALVMSSIEPAYSGIASATMNALRQTGMTLGIALLGTLMTQRAIYYMANDWQISSQYSAINLMSFITGHSVPDNNVQLMNAVHQAFSAGFNLAMLGAGLSVIITLIILFKTDNRVPQR